MSSAGGLQLVTLIVHSYDDAIHFFVEKLGFELVEDSPATTSVGNRPKRWVIVRPPNSSSGASILLARADGPEQEAIVGKQFAGRVGLFWDVENLDAAYERMSNAGVEFVRPIRDEPFGRVTVFRDLYGNNWDLIESTR